MPSVRVFWSKFRPAKLRALVAFLKPRYTASAPLSMAAFRAGRLPAGQISWGTEGVTAAEIGDMMPCVVRGKTKWRSVIICRVSPLMPVKGDWQGGKRGNQENICQIGWVFCLREFL